MTSVGSRYRSRAGYVNRAVVYTPLPRPDIPHRWTSVQLPVSTIKLDNPSPGHQPRPRIEAPQKYFPLLPLRQPSTSTTRPQQASDRKSTAHVEGVPLNQRILFTQEDLNSVLYGKDFCLANDKSAGWSRTYTHNGGTNTSAEESRNPRKARVTSYQIPEGLDIRCVVDNANRRLTQGVFSTIRLEPGTRFGPYTGKRVYLSEVKSNDDNSRMWEVFVNGQLSYFIDGRGPCSNWMAEVRCARTRLEQNVVVTQYDQNLYYVVCDVIEPGNELVVWYGEDYDFYLGIPIGLKLTFGKSEVHQENEGTDTSKRSDKGYQCERCGKMFAYTYYRDKHLKYTRCVDAGDRKFPCELCSRSFEKRDRLRIHVLHVHEKHRPHKCLVCQKTFSQSSSLNKHMRVHNGDRPYKCVYCGKAFTASSILRTHIRQHSGEKPFKCKFCGKSFASHAAHDSHVRRTHAQFGGNLENLPSNTICQGNFSPSGENPVEEETTELQPLHQYRAKVHLHIETSGIISKACNSSERTLIDEEYINVDE